jgi:histidinol-phosphate aminotransferase
VFAAQAPTCVPSAAILAGEALRAMPGVKSWPSDANMILVRVPDAQKTFAGLKRAGAGQERF